MHWLVSLVLFLGMLAPAPGFAADSAKAYVPADGLRLTYDSAYGDGRTIEIVVVSTQSTKEVPWRLADAARVEGQSFQRIGRGEWGPPQQNQQSQLLRYSSVTAGVVQETIERWRQKDDSFSPRTQRQQLWLNHPPIQATAWNDQIGRKMTVLRAGVDVTVAAGNFTDCVVVEKEIWAANTRTIRDTYCPGVGLVRSAHTLISARNDPARFDSEFVETELVKLERIPAEEAARLVREQIKLMQERY